MVQNDGNINNSTGPIESGGGLEQTSQDLKTLLATNPTPTKPVVEVRKPRRKKRSLGNRKEYEVQVIPATKGVVAPGETPVKKKVAAYCRVSTDEEAQASSFDLQVKHYTEYIGARDDWELVGIYADEGISGTQVKHREQFKKMIKDCEAGEIDLIITKSISRFARNTVDCLINIRKLKDLKNPVEVYFEKERLYSLDEKTDMVLSLMASIAQEESRSISANIRWAIKNRMKNGTQKIPTFGLLGYDSDEDGNMIIVESEAYIVRFIYKNFIRGMHPKLIANRLNESGYRTVYDNEWSSDAVRKILRNEKYCGDLLMQKTITIDYLSHASKINEGEAEQYFIPDHHDAIVDKAVWNKAQEILDKTSWKKWKKREQQRLMPVRSGFLVGYISISPLWKQVSLRRLLTATQKIMADIVNLSENSDIEKIVENEREVTIMEKGILAGFEVLDLSGRKGSSTMTVTGTNIKFNKATAIELEYPKFVRLLIKADTKEVAIQPCTEKSKNAIPFSQDEAKQNYAVVLKVPAALAAIKEMLDADGNFTAAKFHGHFYADEKVIIYNLNEGEEVKTRKRRKKNERQEQTEEE